jgi:O-antigen/teichoic acid export membrane protein
MVQRRQNKELIVFNTLITYGRVLLTVVISLYTARVVLSALGSTDYGIFSVVAGVVALFSFINSSMIVSIQRFLSFEIGRQNEQGLKEIVNASLIIHFLIGILVVLLAETLGIWFLKTYLQIPSERFETALWIYHFSVLSFFFTIINVPFQAIINARQNLLAIAYINVIESVLRLSVAMIIVYSLNDKLKAYGILMSFVSLISLLLYYFIALRNYSETKFTLIKDIRIYKKLGGYAGWNLLGVLTGVVMNQGNAILLNVFYGPILNASYAIASQVNGQLSFFSSSIISASSPQIIQNYSSGNNIEMFRLINQTAKFSFIMLFLPSLSLMLKMDYVLGLWLGNVPEYTSIFSILVLVYSLTNIISIPLMTAAQATGKIKVYQIVMSLLLLLNLPISYVLLKCGYPSISIFLCNIIIAFFAMWIRLLFLRKMLGFPITYWLKECFLKIVYVFVCTSIVSYFVSIETPDNFLGLMITTLSVILLGVFMFFIFLDKQEKSFLHSIFSTLTQKIFKK